jgi:hypothetical protein
METLIHFCARIIHYAPKFVDYKKSITRPQHHKNILDNLNIWNYLKCFPVIDRRCEEFFGIAKNIMVSAQREMHYNHGVCDMHNT